jgi:hypothetical protein
LPVSFLPGQEVGVDIVEAGIVVVDILAVDFPGADTARITVSIVIIVTAHPAISIFR